MFGPNGKVISVYRKQNTSDPRSGSFTPVGLLISYLLIRLAWEDPSLRSLADYYRAVDLTGGGSGKQRHWDPGIYSEELRSLIMPGKPPKIPPAYIPWDEWSILYF